MLRESEIKKGMRTVLRSCIRNPFLLSALSYFKIFLPPMMFTPF